MKNVTKMEQNNSAIPERQNPRTLRSEGFEGLAPEFTALMDLILRASPLTFNPSHIVTLRLSGITTAGRQLVQNNHQGLPSRLPVCISVRPVQPADSTAKEGGGKSRHADPINSGSRLASCSGRTWRSLKTRADKVLRCRVQVPHEGIHDRSRAGVGQPTPLKCHL